jgi:CubicO group peptidase (beta-lactamase class C family)
MPKQGKIDGMNIHDLIKPAKSLGFDPDRLSRIDVMLQEGIRQQLYPAATFLVLRHGMIAAHGAYGVAQPDAAPPVTARLDTVFDLASLTKTVTATLLLQCVEEGRLHLDQEVRQHLPEAEKSPIGAVAIRHLATHTSGLPAWKAVYKAESPLHDILETPLEMAEPGKKYTYSDLGYILLGFLLERVTGVKLDALAHDRIFTPLGMLYSGYRPAASLHPMIAATTAGLGEVHDPNAHGMGGVAGHAGLFSSAPDMVRYILALRYPTTAAHYGQPPLLGPLARRLTERRQTDPAVNAHTIGWFAYPNGYLPKGDLLSERTFGHTGFTGTLLMFDPEYDLTFLLLTNRVYYEKVNDGSAVLRQRRLLANVIGGAITT